ncbi:hypothetical protein EJB05_31620, partial [Eragrostis curvula]
MEAGGWLLGLLALSTAITLAVSVPPLPWLDTNAYFVALLGVFFAGVTKVAASVCAADDDNGLADKASGEVPKLRRVAAGSDSEGGLLGLFALSTAFTLVMSVPPLPWLDTGAYFVALLGIFFAGVTQVIASVWAVDHGRRLAVARKLVYASLVVPLLVAVGVSLASLSPAGLLGLFVVSTAITLVVSVPPPPGLDTNAYFLALSGVFFAGMTQVAASVWAADDGGRRLAAGGKLVCASLVVPLLVAIVVSVASSLL